MMTAILKQPKKQPLLPNKSLPWYQHRWPWLLMIMPCVAIMGCALTIWVAIKSHDGLVDDDYYKKGMEVNQTIERDNQAHAMHLSAQVLIAEDKQSLRVVLNQQVKDTLTLELLHPTQAGHDQKVLLQQIGPQLFTATLSQPFSPIAWQVQITDRSNHWRLRGRWDKQNNNMTFLSSQQD